MSLSFDAALRLFRLGRFREILASSESGPTEVARIKDPEHRLLLAEAFLYTGNASTAHAIALANNGATAPPAIRSRCEMILGLAAKREADVDTAVRHLQHAARLAHEAGDIHQAAWSQLHLFRLLIEGQESPQVLAAILAELRRLTNRIGDAHVAAYLHDSVAIMEGQMGRLDECRRHTNIAHSMIERYPNAWLEQICKLNEFCAAYFSCDYEAAAQHAREARRLGTLTGYEYAEHILDLNESHAEILSGAFKRALPKLMRLRQSDYAMVRFSALDGLARLYIALNRLKECESMLRLMETERRDPRIAALYALRWSEVSRFRLMLRTGMHEAASRELEKQIISASRRGDRPLMVALSLAYAEALMQFGNHRQAGRRLIELSELGATRIPDQQAEFYYSSGRIVGLNSVIGSACVARAHRIWKTQGNVWARLSSESAGGPQLSLDAVPHTSDANLVWPQLDSSTHERAQFVLDAVACAFDLATHPTLLAAELCNISKALQIDEVIKVRRLRPRSPSKADHERIQDETIRLSLGDHAGSSIELRCETSSDPTTSVLTASLFRIARAAIGLAEAEKAERTRAALWPATDDCKEDAIYVADEMASLWKIAQKVAPTNIPILITGETGTGKEILARAIHAASPRATATFMPFNCSAGPKDMFDAQLFGHRRGAFTGAAEHAPGVIRAAAGGTLFLDEIGEAPLDVQPKLLRFLESGEIHPLGESHPVRADVRVIAATNLDLDVAVSSGKFREDLFYRLNIVRLHLPPLRERRVEIPVFAQHYLEKYAAELKKGNLRLAEETMEYLLLYRWPGNVRQLANEMRRIVALAETDAVLMPEHLAAEIAASRRTIPASERQLEPTEVVVRLDQPLAAATQHLERAMLIHAFRVCGGRVEDTARLLGLSRKGLYLKRQRLGLEPPATHAKTA